MIKLIFIISLSFAGLYSNAQEDNCAQLSQNWNSEKKVIAGIENTNFTTNETLKPTGKSWMTSAHFYSCDDEFGYLVVKYDEKKYVHEDVPVSLWNSLKGAKSIGGFYNFYIKDNYKLDKKSSNSKIL